MKAIIIGAAIVALGVAISVLASSESKVLVWDRGANSSVPRILTGVEVQTTDMDSIANAMSESSDDVRWATFAFATPDRPTDEDALNIQLSVADGKVGFDWVLLSARNIEDREKFESFARAQGLEPESRTENGVSFIRVETVDAARFAASVVTDMYQLPDNESLTLYHEGFVWP